MSVASFGPPSRGGAGPPATHFPFSPHDMGSRPRATTQCAKRLFQVSGFPSLWFSESLVFRVSGFPSLWFSESLAFRHRLQFGDIELDHLQHGLGHAFGFGLIWIAHELAEPLGRNLPAQAPAVP
jgi:hypothetical protein